MAAVVGMVGVAVLVAEEDGFGVSVIRADAAAVVGAAGSVLGAAAAAAVAAIALLLPPVPLLLPIFFGVARRTMALRLVRRFRTGAASAVVASADAALSESGDAGRGSIICGIGDGARVGSTKRRRGF